MTSKGIFEDVVFICFVYNQKDYVRDALLSAMHQTRLPSKLIILDDASNDGTREVIENVLPEAPEHLSVEYWRNEQNVGLNEQLNKISGLFEDKLLVFQAGDDISKPNRVEDTYRVWIEEKKPPLIVSGYDEISENGEMVKEFSLSSKPQKAYTFKRLVNRRATIFGCCPAYHSKVFNHFGEIPSYIINDDRVNTFRALCLGGILYLHKSLLQYRVGVGVSFYDDVAKGDQRYRIVTDAQRELLDIRCHLQDLERVPDPPKMHVRLLLQRRKRFVQWLSDLNEPLTLAVVVKAIFSGLSIKRVWKIYKKLR